MRIGTQFAWLLIGLLAISVTTFGSTDADAEVDINTNSEAAQSTDGDCKRRVAKGEVVHVHYTIYHPTSSKFTARS
jgi:hypothetical protein